MLGSNVARQPPDRERPRRTNDPPRAKSADIDRTFEHTTITPMSSTQRLRRVHDFNRSPRNRKTPQVLRETIRLIGVVNQNDAVRTREAHPMPDPKIRSDENERAAPRDVEKGRADASNGIRVESGRRRVFAPQLHVRAASQQPPRIDRSPIGAARSIPQRIDEVNSLIVLRRYACRRTHARLSGVRERLCVAFCNGALRSSGTANSRSRSRSPAPLTPPPVTTAYIVD